MPQDVQNPGETSAPATPQFTQFDSWDHEGNPVVAKTTPKTEESAASASSPAKSDSEPKGKSAAEPEAAPKQERKPGDKLSAAEEAARLRKELREAKAELERERSRKPEPKPAESKPEVRAEPSQGRQKPKIDDQVDGKAKYASYEDFVEDLSDWKAEQRIAAAEANRARNEATQRFQDSVSKAREAYADFDAVAEPMAAKVNELILDPKVDTTLKRVLFDSEAVHILYALGSDPKIAEKFSDLAHNDPAEAIYLWKSLKASVKQELAKPKAEAKTEKEVSPEPPKPRAPKPPSEVGGRGAQGEDALVAASKANDFRSFEAEQTRRALASRR